MNQEVLKLFENVNVKSSLYKPVLMLYALGQCYSKNIRLMSFKRIDTELTYLFKEFFPAEPYANLHYAFERLEKNGIWEVISREQLKRSSSGDLMKAELIINIVGGFTENIYNSLITGRDLIKEICNNILNQYY